MRYLKISSQSKCWECLKIWEPIKAYHLTKYLQEINNSVKDNQSASSFLNLEFADLSWKDNTPYSKSFGDLYSSNKGAYDEAKHIFIEGNSLKERFLNLEAQATFSIVEIGFGAGINFLTTCREWLKEDKSNQFLDYIAFDKTLFNAEDFKKTIKKYPELKDCLLYTSPSPRD